jgi:hypothetical protein
MRNSQRRRITVTLMAPVLFLLAVLSPTTATAAATQEGSVQVFCTDQVQSGNWFFAESYPSCGECLQAGAAEEATGNFRAYCLTRSSSPEALLMLNCIVCRGADSALPARVTAPPR